VLFSGVHGAGDDRIGTADGLGQDSLSNIVLHTLVDSDASEYLAWMHMCCCKYMTSLYY
jgi:hypothetical protein